ncbi:transporter substrate-binding domain-containing protein [Allosediminivita pacifica]|uniref:Amino acid ABC transporter substrate-binding protein (PAAT family) n=1 Tax=Allosediminivita pacifica TaxID=1267769 RepID=A0A2T6AJB1_9RHOB|nr:transporter substrate-binding domain-containing protein [Allosediminivita pacifica]PTX43913.1 amino acid ABC transporter substrate-binding protein (PAAT family) [Allosediminivita pacifica]GGB21732.1 polar amino acid ABC transporter substrate-binding protein [Allosediminivita pacifica]
MKYRNILLPAALAALAIPAHAESYKVALDGTFAPHAMPSLSGGVEGFNVDLAAAIGEALGADMEVVAAQFSGLIPALQAGTYDFLVAPTTVTEERASNLLFSEGFMDTNFAFTVPAGTDPMERLEAFSGMTIAVNKGSVYESFLNDGAEEYGWNVVAYGTNTDAVEAVSSGRADANLAGATVSAWAAKQNPRIDLSYEYPTGLVWAFPFRKDDTETRNKIDAVLECLKTNGTMVALSEKWFGVTPKEGTTIVTPTPGYGTPGFEGYDETEHKVSCDF